MTDNSQGSILPGFAANEAAATWLTSSCTGKIVAVDVLWRSLFGGATQSVEKSIDIYDAGIFPDTGNLLLSIQGPAMTDGVINEFRYLDEQQTIPISIPVTQGSTYAIAFSFANPPDQTQGPSIVADTGCQQGKNALFSDAWYSSCLLGVSGDWVIRAVVDCENVSSNADVAISMTTTPDLYTQGSAFAYTIILTNAGPGAAANTTVVDVFPAAYTNVLWQCTATGGAACTSAVSGSGSIAGSVSLPVGSQVSYAVSGIVAGGTMGLLTNSATAVVGNPATDSDSTNNTATLETGPISDRIFANDFEQ
ncbi:MAG TPA: DUF11 domain-containing protein [Rudaea sp.]|nr:DUF11 domain-containing protein [Rudaea sp.]